ncbi:MAG TPA: glycoside hydrolase family 99-like domain-containing protein, partial [Mycobacteriales bacterium]|nr:glycoside hydrolase family 99-like domain-containing protein [Mycobacteriales bacterium]
QSVARYGQLLDNVQADIDASTRPATVDNFVLLYAWNEWHEGGYIEPNARDGCAFLNTARAKLHLTSGSGCIADPG